VDYWNAGAEICIVFIVGDDEGGGIVALVQGLAIYSALHLPLRRQCDGPWQLLQIVTMNQQAVLDDDQAVLDCMINIVSFSLDS